MYPPPTQPYEPFDAPKPLVAVDARLISRTPSPTPSEVNILSQRGLGGIDFKNFRKYFSLKYLPYWIVGIILVSITVLTAIFHKQIVDWLRPVGDKIKALPAGWLIPVALLIVMSFPPLFGHEFVAIVCGVVWGLGVGFAIVALGTLLGELANFFAFRYCCRSRAEKFERNDLRYGLLAQVVRMGGFRVALMARLSLIPPHFTTIIFSVTGMNVFTFTAAAILSLPRQFATVYFGVLSSDGKKTTGQKIASGVVIAGTAIISIYAMRYMNMKIDEAKPAFIYARRKARQGIDLTTLDDHEAMTPRTKYQQSHRPTSSQEALIAPVPQRPEASMHHPNRVAYSPTLGPSPAHLQPSAYVN